MNSVLKLFSLAGLLLLSGCAGLGGTRDTVRVTVSDIKVLESTVFEQLYRVRLRIQNRSDTPLALRGGSFDLAINGRDFGSGVTDMAVEVPAYADAQIDVRMVSTVFGMLRLFQGMAGGERNALTYEIAGRFAVDGRLGAVSFLEAGELALPAAANTTDAPAVDR